MKSLKILATTPSDTPLPMKHDVRLNQRGSVDSWMIAFIFTLLVFLAAAGFGIWAYTGKQDYKNNFDAKVVIAVDKAVTQNAAKLEAQFLEREKEPLRVYPGPESYGSLAVSYPKTWSAYVDDSGKGSAPVDGSFNPNYVPGLNSGSGVALRVQVLNTKYAQNIKTFDSLIKTGKVKASPYALPKVPGTVGLRFDGEVKTGKQGSLVILPLRDKTITVWTEASQFVPDFNTIILPNLTFEP